MKESRIPNPESGKLYRINWSDGSLETVSLIETRRNTAACPAVFTCRSTDGRLFCCSEDMYHETPKQAYEEYEGLLFDGVNAATQSITDAQARLAKVSAEHQRIQQLLSES